MAGIFDFLSLGNNEPGGLLGRINNPLTLAGLGVLSGNNAQQGFAQGLQGFQYGSKQQEEMQKQQQMRQALQQYSQGGNINPLLLSGNPQLMQMALTLQAQQQQDKYQQEQLGLSRRAADRADAAANKPTLKEGPDGNLYQITPDGKATPVNLSGGQGGTGNPFGPGKFNADEGKASGFTDRMLQSEGILSGVTPEGGIGPVLKLDTEGASQGNRAASKIPMVGNFLVGENYQKYDQAKSDFINAQLRRESGAAISPSEFENADRQYFPRPGDTKQVIEQKRTNRRLAVEAMGREGGRSYRPKAVFGPSGTLQPYGAESAPQASSQGAGDPLARARAAIGQGADPAKVRQRLIENGIDPSGL